MKTDFSLMVPPSRHDRHWVVHVERPVPPGHRRLQEADCLAHARGCRWPPGWTPVRAEDVIRRGKFDKPWLMVVLAPDGTVPEPPPRPAPEPGRGRVLCYLDPLRVGLVEDRVHLGGGWYSVGVELKGDGRPRLPAVALAWTADLDARPLPDYRTAGGSLVRAIQDLRIGTTRWAGTDSWGPFLEVEVLEAGRDDPDVPLGRPTPPGRHDLLHVGGLASLGGVVRPYRDPGLSEWAGAAWSTWPEAGTVL